MAKEQDKVWLLYLAQNGHNVRVNVDHETATRLQSLIYNGQPFGIWFDTDAGRLTGLTVNPQLGGLLMSMEPARPIPVDQHGRPVTDPRAASAQIEVKDQATGRLHVPGWARVPLEPNGHGRDVDDPPPSVEDVKDKEPPPQPPGPPEGE